MRYLIGVVLSMKPRCVLMNSHAERGLVEICRTLVWLRATSLETVTIWRPVQLAPAELPEQRQ